MRQGRSSKTRIRDNGAGRRPGKDRARKAGSLLLGVDIGGTFTDLCLLDERGRVSTYKTPSTLEDLLGGVLEGIALAAAEPGYLGFEAEYAAENRTVAVCYWDSYQALSAWLEKAEQWTPGEPSLDKLICTTGCLWPWLLDERQVYLEPAARSVA